jgi:hypothetical protein
VCVCSPHRIQGEQGSARKERKKRLYTKHDYLITFNDAESNFDKEQEQPNTTKKKRRTNHRRYDDSTAGKHIHTPKKRIGTDN